MAMKRTITFALVLPRNICIAILHGYRAVISPLYGDVCRYYPSCSSYTLIAIRTHGVLKGVMLGTLRIARCHPWAAGGVDDVPEHVRRVPQVNRLGFVTGLAARSASDVPLEHTHDHSPMLHRTLQRKV
jgi:putative membrane protein insertion efficiency factor